eukprot:6020358-Lingulodinium_polyedra.AAC.1
MGTTSGSRVLVIPLVLARHCWFKQQTKKGPCGRLLEPGGHLRQDLSRLGWPMPVGSPLGAPPVGITGVRWLPRAPWPWAKPP